MKFWLKKLFKSIIPKKLIFLAHSIISFWPDIKRYAFYSNTYSRFNTESKINGYLTILYHVIEKGLTMPDTRMGFGSQILLETINVCDKYLNEWDCKHSEVFIHTIKVLHEYIEYHQKRNYTLDKNIVKRIYRLGEIIGIKEPSSQLLFPHNAFFQYHNSSFNKFCLSRHSIRNYTDKDIPLEILHECIKLANNSPSDCNRQPTRVYIVKNREKILKVLELQNGNRGFGYLANSILVITSDISLFQHNERNESFLNAGLFSMTLLYALHYNKIGACLLNWSTTVSNDQKLRKLLRIPDKEVITVLLSCGYVPDEVKVASSQRIKIENIYHDII